MACIPAGPSRRGVDSDPHRCTQFGQPEGGVAAIVPAVTITLDTFYIDLTEVTVAAYRHCVKTQRCPAASPLYYDYDGPQQPMTGVNWYHAAAYCQRQGKRLPSEAEWEKAARGPDSQRTSFGDEDVSCLNAVIKDARGRSCGIKKAGADGDKGKVLPVRSRPAGHYGLFDMMGNAEEWVADWWTTDEIACGQACLGHDPRGPCAGGAEPCPGFRYKVVKGGSWYWPAEHATGYHRRRHDPQNPRHNFHHFGFRCAQSAARADTQ